MCAVIRAKLDLVVYLIDTTTGRIVGTRDVEFFSGLQRLRPESRGDGTYVFLNTGREDHPMRIRVKGYDDYEVDIRYSELDQRVPAHTAFLMPSENVLVGGQVISFSGTVSGLKSLEGIRLDREAHYSFASYKERDLTVGLLSEEKSVPLFSNIWYGFVNAGKDKYEKVEIKSAVSENKVRIGSPLQTEIEKGAGLYRITFGKVSEKGRYIFRVRDDTSGSLPVLFRYVREGNEPEFKLIELRDAKKKVNLA